MKATVLDSARDNGAPPSLSRAGDSQPGRGPSPERHLSKEKRKKRRRRRKKRGAYKVAPPPPLLLRTWHIGRIYFFSSLSFPAFPVGGRDQLLFSAPVQPPLAT